jgi:hypothetical protein
MARRANLEAMRPKLNVDLTSDIINEKIVCHLEMQNVGTQPMDVKSMRLYIFDEGFNEDFMLGLANYSTNLFIYDNRILNKVYKIDQEFTYENLIQIIQQLLGYEDKYVRDILTPAHFDRLQSYNQGLKEVLTFSETLVPVLFIRPFFLFPKNIEFYTKLKKMPADTFPQSVDAILFDYDAYEGNWSKDPFALSDTAYRLNWKWSPAWIAPNLRSLLQYKQQSNFHQSEVFARRNDKAILSVSPTELGFPEVFAPQERRSVNFEVSSRHVAEFKIKANLWVTSNISKYLIFKEEITNNYHFTATPRGWNTAVKL